MKQQPLFAQGHQMSPRMEIAMHIAELIPLRNSVERRQAVTAWVRVVREDLGDKLKRGS